MKSSELSDIILVRKPKHWKSNDVVVRVRKNLKLKKVGHAGTLDPLASGLMILGLNNGTKKLNDLIVEDKVYTATIHFNYSTTTYDHEGEVDNFCNKVINLEDIISVLEDWKQNEYYQVPPKFSALKIKGKRAYELARKNRDFQLEPRLVKLFGYEILSFQYNELIIKIKVSKGFYVRSFANDLGVKLNTYACLANLVRNEIGNYKLEDAYEISELIDNESDKFTSR